MTTDYKKLIRARFLFTFADLKYYPGFQTSDLVGGKLDLAARLGNNWYARINANNIFEVKKPNTELGIGIDSLPVSIKDSNILTGNHLGQLSNVNDMPSIDPAFEDEKFKLPT